MALCWAILAGICTAWSWLLPDNYAAAFLGFCGVFFIVATLHTSKNWKLPFLAGVIAIGAAFHWLYNTIQSFGGFPSIAAAAIYIFFVFGSASSFAIGSIIYRRLPMSLDSLGIRAAIAWTGTELLPYLIFPWKFGHTQIGFLPLSQIADIAGASGITFLLFWFAEGIYGAKSHLGRFLFAALIVCFSYGYGSAKLFSYSSLVDINTFPVSVIQANVTTEQKRDILQFTDNLNRYRELTKNELGQDRLIIWPESVFQSWIPDGISQQRQDPRLLDLPQGERFIFGGLTFESESKYYNSALAISPDGSIAHPYHKRILMPFGEYTPLSSQFPLLAAINGNAGNFTAGKNISLFDFPSFDENRPSLRISPLICYEDIVPSMSQEAVKAGATTLVNITNDAWFGNTEAPYQHHRIASFRAIENRRFLIRSTNSGLTALVSPTGETISTLPPFSDGVLRGDIYPSEQMSWYTLWVGEWFGYGCLGIGLFFVLIRFRSQT